MRIRRDNGAPCRVAHVSLGLEMGGMEKLLVEFARHADRKRFHLHFVCLERRGMLADEVESFGWRVEAMGKHPGVRPGLVLRLAKHFRRLGIDVVHTHNLPACLYGVPAARLARVPVVLNTRHGQGEKAGSRQARALAWAARLADQVICVSHDSSDLAVRCGIPPRRVTTIWNGIDMERFAFHGPCIDAPAIVVARVVPEKDIATSLRAIVLVTRQLPQFAFRVVGDGPCRHALESLAIQLGIQNRVEFLGRADDIPGHLSRASMFILSSLTEGVSISLLEAMAIGLPVVATRVGGNVEVVLDAQTGILVNPADPAGIAQAILQLAQNADLSRRMGRAGRRRVEQTFDVRRMVQSYEQRYQGLLSRKNGRGTHRTKAFGV